MLLPKCTAEEVGGFQRRTAMAGEIFELVAVQEIAEESGLHVRLHKPIGTVEFTYY
jgi:hypothetical protein